jgi:hypothetical protein
MGNRSGCTLFSPDSTFPALLGYTTARTLDKLWIDGLTEDENRAIKEIYVNMAISSKYKYIW